MLMGVKHVAVPLSDLVPPSVTAMVGQIGMSGMSARADHTHPSRVQRFAATTDSSGIVTVTFATAFDVTPILIGANAIVASNATQTYTVGIVSITTTQVVLKVFQSQSTPASVVSLTVLQNYPPFTPAPAGVIIHVAVAPPTQ